MNHLSPPGAGSADVPSAPWLWGQAGTVTLADIALILRRRLWLLAVPLLLVLAPGVVVIMGLTPWYTSQATVVIKRDSAPQPPRAGEQAMELQTDLEIVNSERLARKAIAAAALDKDPEFNPLLRPAEPGPFGLTLALPDWRGLLTQASGGLIDLRREEAPVVAPDILESEVLPRFRKNLVVTPVRESRVIQIQFTSERPETAARIPNLLADLYITHQLDAKFEAKKVATGWLQGRIAELRRTVEEQEHQVESFRAEAGIVQGRTSTLVAEQVSAVSTDLITARAETQTALARQREIEAVLRERGAAAVLAAVATNLNPTANRLLERDTELKQGLTQLLGTYGNQHPTVLRTRQEIASLERRMETEAQAAIASARSAAAVAQQKQRTLEETLARLERDMARMKAAEVEMRGLEREAATNRTLLEDFLRQMNAQEQLAVEQPDAWVLSAAAVPTLQAGPNRKLLGAGALIVTGALWIVLVVVAELLEGGIRSGEEVKRTLAATPLGLVPRLPAMLGGAAARARAVVDKPSSAYTEAVRNVHTALLIEQRRGNRGKTVMLTSSVAMEGKSTLVVSLARLVAGQGQRVLVIDCDLRRPAVARLMGRLVTPREPLPEDNGVAGLIREDALSGAHVLPAEALKRRREGHAGAHIMDAGLLSQLLTGVQHLYDVILLDTPPVAPVADARALSLVVDQCVFVVQWRRTSPRVARFALDQLRDAGAVVAGVVVTQVQPKKHALYAFGDSAVSARSAYRYYSG